METPQPPPERGPRRKLIPFIIPAFHSRCFHLPHSLAVYYEIMVSTNGAFLGELELLGIAMELHDSRSNLKSSCPYGAILLRSMILLFTISRGMDEKLIFSFYTWVLKWAVRDSHDDILHSCLPSRPADRRRRLVSSFLEQFLHWVFARFCDDHGQVRRLIPFFPRDCIWFMGGPS